MAQLLMVCKTMPSPYFKTKKIPQLKLLIEQISFSNLRTICVRICVDYRLNPLDLA